MIKNDKYIELNLLQLVESSGEEAVQPFLSSFVCPRNKDVEEFLHSKAVQFARQRLAMTYLVFALGIQNELVGYFTLANKFVTVDNSMLSKTMLKRIGKFSQYNKKLDSYLVSIPLIAQLGKNFDENLSSTISGQTLLSIACDKVREAQMIVGGKMVYIECANEQKLYEFYSSASFVEFGRRIKEGKEESLTLVQMLKYFK